MAKIEDHIERYFAGELSNAEHAELFAQLRAMPEKREYFDHVARLLRVAANSAPTRAESDRLFNRLESRLLSATEHEAQEASQPSSWARWVPVAAALVLVGGIALIALKDSPEQRAYRGAASTIDLVDFEIFAVRELAPGRYDTPRLVRSGERLSTSDLIQFRYRNSSRARRLYLAAVSVEGKVSALQAPHVVYYPRPGGEPLGIDTQTSMTTVARSVRLADGHKAGVLALVAIFSKQPLAADALKTLLARASSQGIGQEVFSERHGEVTLVRREYRVGQ